MLIQFYPQHLAILELELELFAVEPRETQYFVDNRTNKTGKLLPHGKYSSKRSDSLRFYDYLCHVIDDFCLS